ncbi:MAG: stress-induced morphogen [Candidatus Midichloriaceae bacterium]|jgi:stress-induced morphogen
MGMEYELLYGIILENFPDSNIELKDTVGDQNHYEVKIQSKKFNNLSKVKQHKLVNEALKEYLGKDLHALSIKTIEY